VLLALAMVETLLHAVTILLATSSANLILRWGPWVKHLNVQLPLLLVYLLVLLLPLLFVALPLPLLLPAVPLLRRLLLDAAVISTSASAAKKLFNPILQKFNYINDIYINDNSLLSCPLSLKETKKKYCASTPPFDLITLCLYLRRSFL
jgi:hypothetical protein